MEKSLLNKVYQGIKNFPPSYMETPDKIWLGSYIGMALSTSLGGVAYCLVSERNLTDYALKINGTVVAAGRLEILLWMLENAPKTLAKAVQIAIQHDRNLAQKVEVTNA